MRSSGDTHEKPVRRDSGNGNREVVSDAILEPGALEALFHVPDGFIRALLGTGAMSAEMFHRRHIVAETLHPAMAEQVLDGPVHQEIRIPANRRCEMRVGGQREAEVAKILRPVIRGARQRSIMIPPIRPRGPMPFLSESGSCRQVAADRAKRN